MASALPTRTAPRWPTWSDSLPHETAGPVDAVTGVLRPDEAELLPGSAACREGERPDVTVVSVPMLGYPGVVDATRQKRPIPTFPATQVVLRPDRMPPLRVLATLALSRPVALEIDPRNVGELFAYVLPHGLLSELLPEPTTLAAVRGAATAHFARMDLLTDLLHRESDARPRVDEVLLWHDYTDALYFAERGAFPEARSAVRRGLVLDPQ